MSLCEDCGEPTTRVIDEADGKEIVAPHKCVHGMWCEEVGLYLNCAACEANWRPDMIHDRGEP